MFLILSPTFDWSVQIYLYSVGDEIVIGIWQHSESQKRSTWRELESARGVLYSAASLVQGKRVKLVIDSQNACSIIRVGSRKTERQSILCFT